MVGNIILLLWCFYFFGLISNLLALLMLCMFILEMWKSVVVSTVWVKGSSGELEAVEAVKSRCIKAAVFSSNWDSNLQNGVANWWWNWQARGGQLSCIYWEGRSHKNIYLCCKVNYFYILEPKKQHRENNRPYLYSSCYTALTHCEIATE